jgi:putative transposase
MANTYSQIYIQLVFAVKGRANLINESIKDEVEKYISGIITNQGQKLYAIYCNPDHIHILISISPNIKISDLVRDIKANSSKYINEKKLVKNKFSWQEGFGAFSYSKSSINTVVKYVMNQKEHHRKKTFKEEYLNFLEKYEVNYDMKYVFDFID